MLVGEINIMNIVMFLTGMNGHCLSVCLKEGSAVFAIWNDCGIDTLPDSRPLVDHIVYMNVLLISPEHGADYLYTRYNTDSKIYKVANSVNRC